MATVYCKFFTQLLRDFYVPRLESQKCLLVLFLILEEVLKTLM